jgi:hypothetical protein
MLKAHERTASSNAHYLFSSRHMRLIRHFFISPEPVQFTFSRSVSHNECAWVWSPRRPVECFLHRIHSTIRIHIKLTMSSALIVIACDRFSIRRKSAADDRSMLSVITHHISCREVYTMPKRKAISKCIYALIVCAPCCCLATDPMPYKHYL